MREWAVILATAVMTVWVAGCGGSGRPGVSSTTRAATLRPTLGGGDFPPTIYPAPVPSAVPNGILPLCPNPAGLAPVPASATAAAVKAAQQFNAVNLDTDLHNADRSMWPFVQATWSRPDRGEPGDIVLSVGAPGRHPSAAPASEDFVRAACGSELESMTFSVAIGPPRATQGPGPHCLACVTRYFFIVRGDKPLLYLVK